MTRRNGSGRNKKDRRKIEGDEMVENKSSSASLGQAKPPCPACGSPRVAEFFYGLANLDQLKPDLDAGRVVLGGCCLFEDSPQWKCQDCGHAWDRAVDFDECTA